MEVSKTIERDRKLAKTIRQLEEAYDNDLLEREDGEKEDE
jgi:hypothetical protein